MPVYSAGVTYVIGKVFMKHFASGGTLLDFDPPDYREFIKQQQAKFKAQQARFRRPPAADSSSPAPGSN
jgi:hypothetical protein